MIVHIYLTISTHKHFNIDTFCFIHFILAVELLVLMATCPLESSVAPDIVRTGFTPIGGGGRGAVFSTALLRWQDSDYITCDISHSVILLPHGK